MKSCGTCGYELSDESRYCVRCGRALLSPLSTKPAGRQAEEMNMPALYVMVGLMALALLFPPWETPPAQSPQFLGFHFILSPPEPDAMVSRLLLTVELITIAVAGFYLSWLFRKTANSQ